MSHASVESGFLVNAYIVVENQQEESLIAPRMVNDSVLASGDFIRVNIDK